MVKDCHCASGNGPGRVFTHGMRCLNFSAVSGGIGLKETDTCLRTRVLTMVDKDLVLKCERTYFR